MDKHTVKIETKGAMAEIYVDGEKIGGVTSYRIEHKCGSLPELHMVLNCNLQVMDAEVLIPLPEPWRRLYDKSAANINAADSTD